MIKLGDYDSPFGIISVLCSTSTGAIIYEQAGEFQSESDRDGTSLAAYIHALFGLIWEAKAKSVLMVGGAGGTLGTMLARKGCNVTIVDINPTSFPLARTYFNLPDSVRCVVADGRDFLLADARNYDAIVLDAYHGDRIPSHLQSLSFFRLVRSRLTSGGAFFVNIHIAHDTDIVADQIVDCMADVWPEVRLLDTSGLHRRNAIAMGGAVSNLGRPYLLMFPAADANLVDAELAAMNYRSLSAR
ncbi:MAG: spermidine synthase [Rhizomicrobium sp.]